MSQHDATNETRSNRPSLWDRLCRYSITKSRLTRRRLNAFCQQYASDEQALIVHCVDVEHKKWFPNGYIVSSRIENPADLHVDKHYLGLSQVPDASYNLLVCTGLLEHVPDPQRVMDEFRRILRPGGRLILSASAVFPFHGEPDNYFHFTPHGLRYLLRDWSTIETVHGSTQPFESVSVLLQRINMQCDVFPPARLLIEVLQHLASLMDVFVLRQYINKGKRDKANPSQSIMPATLQVVAIR